MIRLLSVIALTALIISFSACGSASTKADVSDTLSSKNTPAAEPPKDNAEAAAPRSAGADPLTDKVSVLTNIDSYLVASLAYPEPGTLTLTNKLPSSVMIQKAIAEVIITKENGDAVRSDFYILENIEPGGSKSTRITTGGNGTKASCHVLKLKSDDLTSGELILVGNKYTPR